MRLVRLTCVLVILALALAGCAGGPRKNIFPPRASIQQIEVMRGEWKILLRLQNFSSVSMTFAKVSAALSIDGKDAGRLEVTPAMRVGPESADIIEVRFTPSAEAAAAVAATVVATMSAKENVSYKLAGRINTSDPDRNEEFSFEGRLSPVPGLTGVLR
jgi:hypothetical protein